MPRTILNSRRSRTSCSLIALATVLVVGASPAAAQSFAGTGSFTFGTGSIGTSTNTTSITVTSPSAVIDWTSTAMSTVNNGVPIVFQPAGTTANFMGSGNYAVLNRLNVVDATRVIQLNGTIQTVASGAGTSNGSIYFYSPSGFMLGGTSIFNVGSLVLSSLPIAVDGSGNFITGTLPIRNVSFGQAANANATISTLTGSQITASAAGSYVAMVAPRVVHNGNINVNGSAALVSAEAATINFSTDGLFDIQVTVGANPKDQGGANLNPLEVYGDIGGPTPTGSSDRQSIYLVAVPKNDALTMVIGNGADLGFTLANTAVDDNGVIILSAGHDIVDGAIGAKSAGHGANASGTIWFTGAHATSNLFGEATGSAYLYSITPSQLTTIFNNDVTVHANGEVSMQSSGAGASLTVGGNVSLSADRTGTPGQSVTAGLVTLFAQNGGTLSIAGTTDLSADAIGGSASVGAAGNGTGGSISIYANDGSTLTLSNLTTSAVGSGGNGLASGINAGNGTGGSLSISATNGGTLIMNSPLLFNAEGHGGSASGAGLAGNGTGGGARILAGDNATMTFNGNVTLDASGFGGAHSSGSGGTGTGGVAQTDLLNNATLTINGNLDLNADATGGNGGSGGSGTGGIANIDSDFGASSGSTMTVTGNTFVNANGYGGTANGAGGTGGHGVGGDAFMGDNANTYNFNGNLTVSAFGVGGSSQSGQGGDGDGGVAGLDSTGANIHVGNIVSIQAGAGGGDGASGGDAFGGSARIRSRNILIDGSAFLNASAFGGFGNSGNGGDGFGGSVQLRAQNGSVSIGGSVAANADGNGGGSQNSGSMSGDGFGGFAAVEALSNGHLGITGVLLASADGFGGDIFAFNTNGGDGFGGSAVLQANGANAVVNLGGGTDITANGKAGEPCGECGAGGIGGDGFGGDVTVQAFGAATASLSIASNLFAEANGEGGAGLTGGGGGGGIVYLGANDGADLHLNGTLFASAEGEGGYSFGSGDGGLGIGGEATVNATTGGTLELDGGGYIDVDGYGGGAGIASSGDGGDGFGGWAGVYANGGSVDIGFILDASAEGHGGYSDNAAGGNGLGGLAEVAAFGGGSIGIDGFLSLSVNGFGGNGVTGGTGTGGGIDDGNGGGTDGAHIFAKNGTIAVTGTSWLSASGFGGSGANGGAGGNAAGGWTTVHAANSNGGPSNLNLAAINISANATGGGGGQGSSGTQGGNGGTGGDAAAGTVTVYANAGNGHLLATNVSANAIATGGQGGNGGIGSSLAGGHGGAGGNAEGGYTGVGTASGNGEAAGSNLGTATFTTISANSSATGGDGGVGGSGTPGGNGGAGGTGDGGASVLLVRGSTATVNGTTTLTSNGYGGDGGAGSGSGSQGAGADGIAGEIAVISTSRYLLPAQHGTLNAGAINGSATGVGGIGSTNGSGIVEGGSSFIVDRSTVNIGSLDFDVFGDEVALGADPSRISITNATVDVDTAFAFSTIGNLSFYIDNGSLTAGTINLAAGNFITDPDNPAPAALGTAFADNVLISTGDDFVADANWDVTNTFVVDAPGLIALDSIHDDNGVDFTAGESISFVDIDAGGSVSLVAGTFITGTDITAGGAIYAQTLGGNIGLDDLTSTFSSITLDAAGDINLGGDLLADGDIILDATGDIDMNNASGGFFMAQFGGTFDAIDITSETGIRMFGGGNITVDDLTAGLPVPEFGSKAIRIDTDGSVVVDDILSAGGIDITAAGSVTGGNVTTGDGLFTDADGAIVYENISAGLVNPQPPSEPFSVGLDSATSINVGNVDASLGIGFVTSGTLTTGDLTTGAEVLGLAHGDILIEDIDADGRVLLADSSMFVDAGGTIGGQDDDGADIEAIFAATPVATNGSITVGNVIAGSFQAAPGTFFSSGNITTDGLLYIDAGTNISGNDFIAGDIFSPAAVNIEAGNNIELGDVTSGESIGLTAEGNITTEDLFAYGSITVDAGGAVDLGNVTTEFPPLVLLAEGIGGPVKSHSLGPSIEIYSDTSVDTLDIDSAEDVIIDTAGYISTGNITAAGWINLVADTDITTLDLTTDLDVNLDAGDDITFADANVGTEFDFDAGGDVASTGNITAGNQISGEAGGTINLGNLTVTGDLAEGEIFSIGMTANGNITVANVSGTNPVGFGTHANLVTSNVSAGGLFMALVGGNATTGSIATTGEGGGQVYIADDSMFELGEVGEDDFDPNPILALNPVATGGSITINGPVTTGLFRAAAGTGLTTQAITATDIFASAGRTATLNGLWDVSDSVSLTSNDIDITGTGGIDAEGFLTLRSANATQMLIGDGLSGSGYVLSNAEFGRISGYEVDLIGRSDASAAADILVGDLNVTGPLAGSNVEGSDLNFATYDFDSEVAPAGVIRVVGDVNATGFAVNADQSINFFASRFELDAATGSISIFSSGSTLGGELGLYANRIHVAAGSILDQLATNPTYTGYQQDLNEAAAVQRPEGVLRADTIFIDAVGLQDVLIQNTGTAATPAGFLVRDVTIPVEDAGSPAASINLVVNGQVVTEGGTVTGVAARDALVTPEDNITPFTANSTINGCPLTGECIIRPPEPPPVANVVDNQIDLITSNPLGDSEFGNEPDIDDNSEGDEGANNPISPPQPLFDTRPLIPASEVNDPVSGTGNPALLGSDQCDEEDQNQCPAKGDSQ